MLLVMALLASTTQAFFMRPATSTSSPSLLAAQRTTQSHDNGKNDMRYFSLSSSPLAGLGLLTLNVFAPLFIASTPAHALPQKAPETNAQMLLIEALPNKNPLVLDMASSLSKITTGMFSFFPPSLPPYIELPTKYSVFRTCLRLPHGSASNFIHHTEGSGNIRSIDAKGSKGIKPWPEVQRAARSASGTIAGRGKDLIKGATDEKAAQAVLNDLNIRIDQLGAAADAQDREAAVTAQIQAMIRLEQLGTLQVAAMPFQPPTADYPAVPQLLGRAEIEITTRAGKTRQTRQMYAVLDGYSAPLSAGQFVDLAKKKAFDDTKVVATDESSVTFTADAAKAPKRTVPLEIFVAGDKEPTYGESLEEQGRFKERTVLPFNAYGTIAMLHPPDDPNGGANSFFFLKADPSYTPAGLNTLDGAFSVVGYVVKGEDALDDLLAGDAIESVKVLSGLELLKQGSK